MSQQVLFLMLGYPGSGKTTVSKLLHEQTNATHIWADHERRQQFGNPTYSHKENVALYDELNEQTEQLLATGKSVIYDTNFNFYRDRQLMRQIAAIYKAKTLIVWIKTPIEIARTRATQNAHKQQTRVLGDMPLEHFERIAHSLEPPHADEEHAILDGTNITPTMVTKMLEIHGIADMHNAA